MLPQNPSYTSQPDFADLSQYLHTLKMCNVCFSWEHDDSACPVLYGPHETMEYLDNTATTYQHPTSSREPEKQTLPAEYQQLNRTSASQGSSKETKPQNMDTDSNTDNEFPSVGQGCLDTSLLNSPLIIPNGHDEYPSLRPTLSPMAIMQSFVVAQTMEGYSISTMDNQTSATFIPGHSLDVSDTTYWPEQGAASGDETSYFNEAVWSDQFESKV
jgi:hypothetical protein